MANRTEVLNTLQEYFKTKGRVLNSHEYSHETDTPISFRQVEAYFGNWKRVEKLLMANRDNNGVETDVMSVIRAQNDAAHAAREQWIEASENQDAKAAREAQAQAVAEKLAANAATAAGANANKIAIGGPLPHEQPDYAAMGATVNVDPVTKEPTVVDPDAEQVTTVVEDPRTPAELRAVATDELKAGTVKTGDATDGGSQGQASIATIAAIGGDDNDTKTVETKPAKAADKK